MGKLKITSDKPVVFQVVIQGEKGRVLAYKKDDEWRFLEPPEQTVDFLFEYIKQLKK